MMPPDTLPALSVRQPWADLILRGFKTLEVRGWTTRHRGPLVIHASAAMPHPDDVAEATSWADGWAPPRVWARGCVVALVQLEQIERTDLEDDLWSDARWRRAEAAACGLLDHGCYLWRLDDVTPLRQITTPGRQSLWRVDSRLVVPA